MFINKQEKKKNDERKKLNNLMTTHFVEMKLK